MSDATAWRRLFGLWLAAAAARYSMRRRVSALSHFGRRDLETPLQTRRRIENRAAAAGEKGDCALNSSAGAPDGG